MVYSGTGLLCLRWCWCWCVDKVVSGLLCLWWCWCCCVDKVVDVSGLLCLSWCWCWCVDKVVSGLLCLWSCRCWCVDKVASRLLCLWWCWCCCVDKVVSGLLCLRWCWCCCVDKVVRGLLCLWWFRCCCVDKVVEHFHPYHQHHVDTHPAVCHVTVWHPAVETRHWWITTTVHSGQLISASSASVSVWLDTQIFLWRLSRLWSTFSALTLLFGWQEGHPACEKLVLVYWWWWFDWSFVRLIHYTSSCTTYTYTSSCHHHFHHP